MKITPFPAKAFTSTLLLTVATVVQMHAATFTVTNTADSGAGSLRQAVLDAHAAAGADAVVFDPAIFSSPQTITLASVIALSRGSALIDDITIVGPGSHLLTINGNNVTRHFSNNTGDTSVISGMTLTGGNETNGGSISNVGIMTLTNIVFHKNTSNSAGAVFSNGNGTSGGVLNIAGCDFTDNTTTGTNVNGDGGSALEINAGKVTITNSKMTGGTTRGGGGAIRNGGVLAMSDCTVANNTSGGAGNSDGGGGINSTGQLTLTNCLISNNTAGEGTNGGGLDNEGQMTLINTIVTGNSAGSNGGGINMGGTQSSDFLRIIDSTISNNKANTGVETTGVGGGISVEGNPGVTLIRSTVSGNQVPNSHPTSVNQGHGGGIWSDGQVVMDACTVSGNIAARDFGGVRVPSNFSDSTITNSTIVNNTAATGGGLGRDNCNLSCRQLSIGNTIIANNTAGTEPDIRNRLVTTTHSTTITSLGYNLFETTAGAYLASQPTDLTGVDPNVTALEDHGGPTFTHVPQPGSPVLDKGKRLSDVTTDQRGVGRPFDDPNIANANGGDGSEIGAVEFGEALVAQEKTLGNIATRLPVQTGENVMIGGFIVTGDLNKPVLIRGMGPSLNVGLNAELQDPMLELYDGSGNLITENDNWKDAQEAEIRATQIPPNDDREAAMVRALAPGSYTAILRGKDDTIGVALLEIYDLDIRPNSRLANISTRGFSGVSSNVLIGGFIVGPNTRVVVRGIGPSLANVGVQGPLADPNLQLVNGNGEVVRSNDNWKGTQREEIEALGLQPSDDREAVIVATLPAGGYTAVMGGAGENGGVALVEVYNLP